MLRLILKNEFDDEETESNDLTQFKVVSNKTRVYIICDSIRKFFYLSRFKKLHFEKLDKADKMKIEEAMY